MRLLLLRHAKTEAFNDLGDRVRMLTDRGKREATALGASLRNMDVDYALVSTAMRTRQTFDALDLDCPAVYLNDIYEQDLDLIRQHISEVPDDVETLLVVGHYPSLPDYAIQLALDAGEREAALGLADHFPTCTCVIFDFEGSWADAVNPERFDNVSLVNISRPGRNVK